MFLSIIPGLALFGSRRGPAAADDLDVALAGAQIGLERKRQRWLLFLIEREEQCLRRIAQTAEIDSLSGLPDPTQENKAEVAPTAVSEGIGTGTGAGTGSQRSHDR